MDADASDAIEGYDDRLSIIKVSSKIPMLQVLQASNGTLIAYMLLPAAALTIACYSRRK